ncbi:hypothetical protein CPB86DRAFT_802324 [Serendipita vermifera]|nr:hypothetical protein CPB86DRAFT_802324 [Serendipita vermifera]
MSSLQLMDLSSDTEHFHEGPTTIPTSFYHIIPILSPFEAPNFVIAIYRLNWLSTNTDLSRPSYHTHDRGRLRHMHDHHWDRSRSRGRGRGRGRGGNPLGRAYIERGPLDYPKGVNSYTIFARVQTHILERLLPNDKNIKDNVCGFWSLLDEDSRHHWYWFSHELKAIHTYVSFGLDPVPSVAQINAGRQNIEVGLATLCAHMKELAITDKEYD